MLLKQIIIRGAIVQGAIVREAIIRGAIVRWAIVRWAIILGGSCPGDNYPEGNCPVPQRQHTGTINLNYLIISKSIEFELCDMKLTTLKVLHQMMKFDSDK